MSPEDSLSNWVTPPDPPLLLALSQGWAAQDSLGTGTAGSGQASDGQGKEEAGSQEGGPL